MDSSATGAARPFVAKTRKSSTGRRRPQQQLHLALVLLSILVLFIAQAAAQAPPGVRPSAFITSTRPAPAPAPTLRGGGGAPAQSGGESARRASSALSPASTATSISTSSPAAASSTPSNPAALTDTTLTPSNSSAAMAPIAAEDVTKSASLDTKLDAAFGILGTTLVLSGLILATAGAAYRRLTCFIVTSYAIAVVTMALILHFGVEKQIDPPRGGIRVAFVVASLAAGTICGLGAAIFHRGAKIVIAPVAGFLFGLVLQGVRNDGLIRPIGPRYLLFLGLAGTAFILGLIPRYFDAVILVSTAFLGALAFALGIDCFTTAGLKEFFVMNLGFTGIFPQLSGHFQISSIMQIELGLIALFCISIAIQIRFFNLFEKRLARLFAKSEESDKRKREEDEAAQRIRDVMNGDVEKFEHRYSRRFPFAIPNSLPVVPAQAHFDSKNSSPSLPSHITSFSNGTTPKSENAPLLPELNYVTTASKRSSTQPSDVTLAIKPSESNKSFFSQMKSLMSSTSGNNKENDVPPVPSLNRSTSEESKKTKTEATNLEQEIAEREQALQKIKTIRESIDQMRTNLKSQSQDGSASTDSGTASLATAAPPSETIAPAPPTAATKPANHRHSVSFTGISDPVPHRSPTMASFTAPRPLSQHSILVTQQHARGPSAPPMQSHSRSSSQQSLARPRPISSYSHRGESATNAGSPGMQSRRQSTMSMDTGRTSLTIGTGEIQHSQRVFFAEPSRYSTGPPQRVVTGVMAARMPSQDSTGSPIIAGSTAPQRQSMVRTQTMDILDLHAKHRRRMSDLQNTATIGTGKSSVAEPKSATMTSSASQPSFKTVGPARKRSSTVTGLSSLQTTSLPVDTKKQKRTSVSAGIDELGRRPSPTIRTGISPSATMPVNATSKSAPSPKLPTSARPSVGARTGASLEAARDSEAAWLSY